MESREKPFAGRSAAPLQLYLLGRFEVVRGDAPIPSRAWRRRRPADLLKLVALAPGRTIPRDEAIELLWPGKDGASGANNLHRALYDLRQVLGERWVDVDRGVLGLRDEAWVDAIAFEGALESGDPGLVEPALALYRGDLSPEDRESSWLRARRERLRALFAESALPLAQAAAGRGDAGRAIALLKRIVEVQPAAEAAAMLLVRLLAESGRRGEALRVYDACDGALREARRAGPGAELRELRDAIQRGAVGPAQMRAPYDGARRASQRLLGAADLPPLRGSSAARLLLESLVEQGAGTIVFVGEAGVGKTRLAVEGARIAQEGGAVVLAGTTHDGAVPRFAPFADAFGDWVRAGGGTLDPFAGAEPAELGQRLFEGVRAAVSAAGAGRPVCLLVDDLHTVDEPSATLFQLLAREARQLRLILVATCREDRIHAGTPVQTLLAHLDCERLARGVRVQRLDLESTRAQVRDVAGEPGDGIATQVYRVSAGNPLYTEELARCWHELRRLPSSLDPAAALRERIARLGPRVGELLAAAAAAGHHFDVDVVRQAVSLSGHDAVAALDACLGARVIEDDGPGFRFRHELLREALYAALPHARRAPLHRAIAAALAARAESCPGGSLEVAEPLARHLRAAGDTAAALPHIVASAHRAAARGAHVEALRWCDAAQEAAEEAGAPAAVRLEVLEAQGAVQLALGDVAGALQSYETAAALATAADAPHEHLAVLRRGAAVALAAAGRAAEALERLRETAAIFPDAPERAESEALQAAVEWHTGHTDPPQLVARACECRLDVHLALWERALAEDRTTAQLDGRAAAFLAIATDRGAAGAAALARAVEGTLSLRAGRWDVADPALRDATRRARDAGAAGVEAFALEGLGNLLTARNRLEEGLAAIGDGLLAAARAPLRRHLLVRLYAALSRNREAAGAPYAADEAIREASATVARHPGCALCDAAFRPQMVRIALRRGRVADADHETQRLESAAARDGARALAAVARSCRAAVLAAQGWDDAAAAARREARAIWDELGCAAPDA